MLLFVLLSNFYGNKVQDIQIENYPTKIFLKKTEILFATFTVLEPYPTFWSGYGSKLLIRYSHRGQASLFLPPAVKVI